MIHRKIAFQLGDAVIQAVAAFKNEDRARKECRMRDQAIRDLLHARMVSVETGEVVGAQVSEFLNSMGITSVGHIVLPVTVQDEKNAVEPASVTRFDGGGKLLS